MQLPWAIEAALYNMEPGESLVTDYNYNVVNMFSR